jgi:hypothetical protein
MAKQLIPRIPGNAWYDSQGGLVIESRVAAPPGRKGFERQFFPGIEVGLAGWERAHSQGSGTGHESPFAIRYAPEEVNQEYQRLGIERFIRELFELKGSSVELNLTTVTFTHPGTLRLKEIQYRVDAVRGRVTRALFEVSIEVEDKRTRPKVIITAQERMPRDEWESALA